MGEHKRNPNALRAAAGGPPADKPVQCNMVLQDGKVVLVFDRHLNNLAFTPEQAVVHANAILQGARTLNSALIESTTRRTS